MKILIKENEEGKVDPVHQRVDTVPLQLGQGGVTPVITVVNTIIFNIAPVIFAFGIIICYNIDAIHKDLVTKPSPSQSMLRKCSVKRWASNKGTFMLISWVIMLNMMSLTLYSAASFSISGS